MVQRHAESPRVTALLGPTNTGKTHMAVERMLAHRSGMIGFPLRLLAREIYDRVVSLCGPQAVALVTGEEKYVPPRARYFLCTVEAMPLDRPVDFLAIDEIQLAADRERGHVFTDRLLHARGTAETMLLGAETMRPLIRVLVPEASFIRRPRLSGLSHDGHRKLSRLAGRSAVIAFSAEAVYGLAEEMRSLRGGCAVILGALSPRTRNAQVEMYQSGEVDYLVATDAIGMGLNMDIEHVAFSADRKFDGRGTRRLRTAELAQIAGRAGRYMANGTFGTTGTLEPFEPPVIEALENHRFPPIREAYWRNSALSFASIEALLQCLEATPAQPGLRRAHNGDDHLALLALARDPDIAAIACTREHVALLWEACQIPDYRKTMAEAHIRLVRQIYLHLVELGHLPNDWVAAHIGRLDRVDGDLDTLTTRISHVRTWTYVSHRAGWIAANAEWQERTRALEDRLSDALHERLTQRFVDRRAGAFARRRGLEPLFATVNDSGEVLVEGHRTGRITGFRFVPDADAPEQRALKAAANRALEQERGRRVGALAADANGAFALGSEPAAAAEPSWGVITWHGEPVGRLTAGDDVLNPAVALLHGEHLSGAQRERVRRRLASWLENLLKDRLRPLFALRDAPLEGAARGIAFALSQALGCMARHRAADQLRALDRPGRRALTATGIRVGRLTIHLPAMRKPARARLAVLLWCTAVNAPAPAQLPPPEAVSAPRDESLDPLAYRAAGFEPLGERVLRADIAERVAQRLSARAKEGPVSVDRALLMLAGCKREAFESVLEALGYAANGTGKDGNPTYTRRRKRPRGRRPLAQEPAESHSPFAKLRRLADDGLGAP